METLPAQKYLDFSPENLVEAWKEELNLCLMDTSATLHIAQKGQDLIYSTFQFTSVEDKYNIDMEQFDAYCGQKFNDFVTVLCSQATDCELGELTDLLVKDVFIIGTNDFHLNEHQSSSRRNEKLGQGTCKDRIRDRYKKREISSDLNSPKWDPGSDRSTPENFVLICTPGIPQMMHKVQPQRTFCQLLLFPKDSSSG